MVSIFWKINTLWFNWLLTVFNLTFLPWQFMKHWTFEGAMFKKKKPELHVEHSRAKEVNVNSALALLMWTHVWMQYLWSERHSVKKNMFYWLAFHQSLFQVNPVRIFFIASYTNMHLKGYTKVHLALSQWQAKGTVFAFDSDSKHLCKYKNIYIKIINNTFGIINLASLAQIRQKKNISQPGPVNATF